MPKDGVYKVSNIHNSLCRTFGKAIGKGLINLSNFFLNKMAHRALANIKCLQTLVYINLKILKTRIKVTMFDNILKNLFYI